MRAQGSTDLFAWQIDRADGAPIFRQIYRQMRAAILLRTFPAGTKLPSTRALAARLGVARMSVVSAYEQLFAEGYLSGKIGSGTYVSSDLPEPIERGPARRTRRAAESKRVPQHAHAFSEFVESTAQEDDRPFNPGRTLIDGRTVDIWRKLTNQALRSFGEQHLGYSDPCGFIELRRAICEYLRAARDVRCEPDQIIVTAGTQQGFDIATRVLLRPGDEVWIEDPGYPLFYRALEMAGVELRSIPVDAQGIDVGAGARIAPRASVAVVTPSHQFPTGVVLSMARRRELLAWARAAGAWIFEDDYASEYRYSGRPLASLQGLDDGERVIYFGTLNKVLFPGLRVGYIVVPRALLPAFISARYLMDRQPPTLYQTVLAEFMRQGYLAAHIRRMRLLYREQRDTLVAELSRRAGSHVRADVPDQGMHLVAYLGAGQSDIAVERAAREHGVVVRATSRFYKASRPRSALMLGFSGYPRPMIVPAAARLAQVLESNAMRPSKKGAARAAPRV